MRYLRIFNESISVNDLEKLCDEGLAYLKDYGFEISLEEKEIFPFIGDLYYVIVITISKSDYKRTGKSSKGTLFKWEDVKEDVIQFLDLLKEYYSEGNAIDDIVFISPGPYGTATGVPEKILANVKSEGKVAYISNSSTIPCKVEDIINDNKSISEITNNTDVLLGIDIII